MPGSQAVATQMAEYFPSPSHSKIKTPLRLQREPRNMAKKQEPSTPVAGGTPWKGLLRSHHAMLLNFPPPRLPSRARNRDEDEEAQTFKHAAPKNPGRRRTRDGNDGAARPPRVPPRRSPRNAGRDPGRPIMIDWRSKECKFKGNKSAITPLWRSRRFHPDDKSSSKPLVEKESYQKQPPLPPNPQEIAHNRKTQNSFSKDKHRENPTRSQRNTAVKPLSRMKSPKEPQRLGQDSQDIYPRRKIADVSSKESEMQELKPNHCEVLTRKRKRGNEGRLSSAKQCHHKPKSLPPDCQEIAPSIEPRNTIHEKSEKYPSSIMQSNIGDDRLMNTEENNEELSGVKGGLLQQFCGSDDWTEEQDMALRQAYFTARPSPHFWKKVSKMVPGKSAEECFNRVHADLSTPTPIAPRPRTSKTKFSPLGHFTLSDTKFPNLLEPTVRKQRTTKQKSLVAQKTVRHLLKKHCLIDQAQEADHFSVFETSPTALQLNISFEYSPGTPDNYLNSGSLHKCSESSPKKPLPRLKTKQAELSPAVLKPVKNVILHEKYIDQLSRREGTKRPRKKAAGTKATDSMKTLSEQQAGGLKAARNALITEATDFISHFKKLQANSLRHVLENSEDDECNTINSCHDDDE